jgi:uncharacterized protein (TIGR03437 family)
LRILTQILLCLVPFPLFANSTNVPAGSTGGFGEPTCVQCHTGTLNPASGKVSINAPALYTPGITQTLQVVITDSGAAAWGFELSARFTNGTQAGAFTPSSTVAVRTANSVQYAAQSSAAMQAGTQFQFNVSWTAPPDTTGGPVVFDVVGLAANDDTHSTDRTYAAEAHSASAAPSVNANGVVSAASYQSPVGEGQLVSIFGQNLTAGGPYQAAGFPLPYTLGGTQVFFGGLPCAIVYASPEQINAQIPYGISAGTVSLYVQENNTPGPPVSVTTVALAPALVTASATGTGPGAILHADYGPVTAARPATVGETVLIFATGLGQTTPQASIGAPAPLNSQTVATVTVMIGGKNAPASYSGLAPGFAGLYQINAVIPSPLSGIVEVLVTAGAGTSRSGVTVQIQ